ncbi:MAG: hypothetical protein ACREB3_06190 [Burkholderiales bacterium]
MYKRMINREEFERLALALERVYVLQGNHGAGRATHGFECPNRNSYYLRMGCGLHGCTMYNPIYIHELAIGLTLDEWEHNGAEDSDWYVRVWNPVTQAPEVHEYASTRGWCYPCYNAIVDATPEARAAYVQWQERQRVIRESVEHEEWERTPTPGKVVKVIAGRKFTAGTILTVTWAGETRYGDALKVRAADGTETFVNPHNVEVVRVEEEVK